MVTSTSVTSAEPVRRQPRRQHRHLTIGTRRPSMTSAADLQHLEVGQLVGAADLEDPAERLAAGRPRRRGSGSRRRRRSAGCGSRPTSAPPSPAGSSPAGGSAPRRCRRRRPRSRRAARSPARRPRRAAPRPRGASAGAARGRRRRRRARPCRRSGARPAVGGRPAEGPGGLGVLALEVGVVEGVHQVDGDVDALERRRPACRRSWTSPPTGVARPVVLLGAAGHRPDVVPARRAGRAPAGGR